LPKSELSYSTTMVMGFRLSSRLEIGSRKKMVPPS